MANNQIHYDRLVENALRGVVREILVRVASAGLPGTHHFYIAFKTRARGVELPPHLLERYPDEMTIVLQHRFWGLEVHDDSFEVHLSFDRKLERLVVPFDAVIGFVDPSVQFALQFQDEPSDDRAQGGRKSRRRPEPAAAGSTEAAADAKAKKKSADDAPAAGEKVVTLDAFRKKP